MSKLLLTSLFGSLMHAYLDDILKTAATPHPESMQQIEFAAVEARNGRSANAQIRPQSLNRPTGGTRTHPHVPNKQEFTLRVAWIRSQWKRDCHRELSQPASVPMGHG